MIIEQNLTTTNHRKSGESKYDRKVTELDVVTTRIRYHVNRVQVFAKVRIRQNDSKLLIAEKFVRMHSSK